MVSNVCHSQTVQCCTQPLMQQRAKLVCFRRRWQHGALGLQERVVEAAAVAADGKHVQSGAEAPVDELALELRRCAVLLQHAAQLGDLTDKAVEVDGGGVC